eukprot:g9324.t1
MAATPVVMLLLVWLSCLPGITAVQAPPPRGLRGLIPAPKDLATFDGDRGGGGGSDSTTNVDPGETQQFHDAFTKYSTPSPALAPRGRPDDGSASRNEDNGDFILIVAIVCSCAVLALSVGVAFYWCLRRKLGGDGRTKEVVGSDGSRPGRVRRDRSFPRIFPRAFLPISIFSSAWATAEDDGEDCSVEAINGTNPMLSESREAQERGRASWSGSKAVSGESAAESGWEGGGAGAGTVGPELGERSDGGESDSDGDGSSNSSPENERGGDKRRGSLYPGQHHRDDLRPPSSTLPVPSFPLPHRRIPSADRVAAVTPESEAGLPRAGTRRIDDRIGRSSGGRDTASTNLRLELGRPGKSPSGDRPSSSPGTPVASRESPKVANSPTGSRAICSFSQGTSAMLKASGLNFLKNSRRFSLRTSPVAEGGGGGHIENAELYRKSASSPPSPRTLSRKQKLCKRSTQAFSREDRGRTSSLPPTPRSQCTHENGPAPSHLPPDSRGNHHNHHHHHHHHRHHRRGTSGGGRCSADRRRPTAVGRGSSYSPPPSRQLGRRVTHVARTSNKSRRAAWRGESAGGVERGGGRHGGAGAGAGAGGKGESYWGKPGVQQQQQTPAGSGSCSSSEGTGASIARAADELTHASIVPAVRDAAALVARLAKLAGKETAGPGVSSIGGGDRGHCRSSSRDREQEGWVGWCRSIVQTLERAGQVLGQATAHDGQAERVLMEDIKENISEMSEIMQLYESRSCSAVEASLSALCGRRKGQVDVAINAAVSRLQLIMKIRAGYSLEAEASDSRPQKPRRSSREILAEATWRRRQQRLDQVEIRASEVKIMEDELLGKGKGAGGGGGGGGSSSNSSSGLGPGGTLSTAVYLANCNGLNAAVKVFLLKAGAPELDTPGGHHCSRRRCRHDGARAGCGFQKKLGRPGGAAAKNGGMHEEDEEIERMFGEAEADGDDGRRHAALVREVATLKRLRNPRIVTLYGAVRGGTTTGGGGGDPLLLAMELLPGGSLRQRLQRSTSRRRGGPLPLSWKALRGIVKDVCAGMAFLHGESFVHGGLSSTNVLLDAKGRAKISDLGALLRTPAYTPPRLEAGEGPVGSIGTRVRYTAPEVLDGRDATLESDVYAFGMLVLECLTRELPWASAVTDVRALAWAVTRGDRPEVPRGVPRDLVALVRACWAHDPLARPALDLLLADLSSEIGVFRGGGGGGGGARSDDGAVVVAARTPDGRERVSTGGGRHGGGAVALVTEARARRSTLTGEASGVGRRHASPSPGRGDAARRSHQQREGPGTPTGEGTASMPSRRAGSGGGGGGGGGGEGRGGAGRMQKKAGDPRDTLPLVRRLHGDPARGGVAISRHVSRTGSSLSTSTTGCAPAEMDSLHMK